MPNLTTMRPTVQARIGNTDRETDGRTDGQTNKQGRYNYKIKRSNKKMKGFGQRDRASRVSEDIFLWYHGRGYCETALSVALQVDGTLRRQLLQKKALILSVCIDISRPSEATAK